MCREKDFDTPASIDRYEAQYQHQQLQSEPNSPSSGTAFAPVALTRGFSCLSTDSKPSGATRSLGSAKSFIELVAFGPAGDKWSADATAAMSMSMSSFRLGLINNIGKGKADYSVLGSAADGLAVSTNRMLDFSEVQLISLSRLDKHVRVRLGGLVMAKSVKFLGKLETSLSDQETREGWWEELRDEMKGHAKTLCCSHIIGYAESCTIYGEVCVLSAIGTASVVKVSIHPTVLSHASHQSALTHAQAYGGGGLGLSNCASNDSMSVGEDVADRYDSQRTRSSRY